jgi:hypothetical protein
VKPELLDGVVLDVTFIERIDPESLHGQDVMDVKDEDDSFLSIGTEVGNTIWPMAATVEYEALEESLS